MLYRKLRRTYSHGEIDYIPMFRELFPELKKVNNEDLADRFRELKLDFFHEEKTEVKFWNRVTLPFAILLFLIMFLGIPFYFLISGRWGYPFTKENKILNWFRSLGLY